MSRFRLEKLLEHRRNLSDAAQQRLAASTRAHQEAAEHQRQLSKQELDLHEGIAHTLLQGTLRAGDLQHMHALAVQSGEAVQRAAQVVQNMVRQQAQAQGHARDAAQAHRALENARERFLDGQRAEEQRLSLREADEIAGVRVARAILSSRTRAEE